MIKRLRIKDWVVFGSLGSGALLGGCSYQIDKNPTGTLTTVPVTGQQKVLGYNSLRTRIFAPHCISCHGNSGASI